MRISSYLRKLAVIFFASSVQLNCIEEKKNNPFVQAMDSRTKIRYKQYMITGKRLYLRECANCHGNEGEGLAQLIPPLARADYLLEDIERAACEVRHGINGKIVVNDTPYDQEMPANPKLRALEIAEIITYITNSWGNEKGLISARDVGIFLNNCPDGR